jgi:hypothetical protein
MISMFLVLMVIGLAGLAVMALPALGGGKHGHSAGGHAHHMGGSVRSHAASIGKLQVPSKAGTDPFALERGRGADRAAPRSRWWRLLPSPRVVFSLLALYGASGNVLAHVEHIHPLAAALLALVPALAVERLAVTPLWNFALRFQSAPSSPLSALVLEEASAVTPFRNGRGVVAVVRDGRLVQFSAHLVNPQSDLPVRVGDRLRIEDVDADRERLTVSLSERRVS